MSRCKSWTSCWRCWRSCGKIGIEGMEGDRGTGSDEGQEGGVSGSSIPDLLERRLDKREIPPTVAPAQARRSHLYYSLLHFH